MREGYLIINSLFWNPVMNKRFATSIFILLSGAFAHAQKTTTPNLVLIMVDDMGYSDVGAYGSEIQTPTLDKLAAEGIQLRRSYCCAPICAPSRASLLTGVHQGHAKVRNQEWDKAIENNHTLATTLKQAGYATAAFGKWGLGGDDVP